MADKYKVIVNKLELELKRMRSEGKMRLPSEQDLCKEFSCSRQTIRAALEVLLQKGLIVKRRGAGSFISDDTFTSRTVFFMTEDCDRYQSPALIQGLKEQPAFSGYDLKSFSTGGSIKVGKDILMKVISERPAALIIEPSRDLIPNPNSRIIEEISDMQIPVIFCNSILGPIHVVPDNEEGTKELTKHLFDTGRKKIACIFRMDDSSGRDRYQGYIKALLDSDSEFDESACLLLSYHEEKDIISGKDKKLEAFVHEISSSCDAVICQNGMIANQLVNMLLKKKISVPDDIAVGCFDNGLYSENCAAGLMTMGYDNDLFCKSLAGTVTALAEGRRTAKSVKVPMRLTETFSNSVLY